MHRLRKLTHIETGELQITRMMRMVLSQAVLQQYAPPYEQGKNDEMHTDNDTKDINLLQSS